MILIKRIPFKFFVPFCNGKRVASQSCHELKLYNMSLLSCGIMPMSLNWVDLTTLYHSPSGIWSQGGRETKSIRKLRPYI